MALGKVIKVGLVTIAVVAGVSAIIGENETADLLPAAADKGGWAAGATGGSVRWIGPGAQRGFEDVGNPATDPTQ